MNVKNNLFKLTLLSIAVCVAGCDESNQEPAQVSVTTVAPTPAAAPAPVAAPVVEVAPVAAAAPIKTTTSIKQLPEWIKNAKNDEEALCYVDLVNNKSLSLEKPFEANNSSPMTIAGWVIDKKFPDATKTKLAFEIASKDHKHVYVYMADRFERMDVAKNIAFRDLGVKLAGASLAADTTEIVPGTYELKFIVQRNAKEGITCSSSKHLWNIKF